MSLGQPATAAGEAPRRSEPDRTTKQRRILFLCLTNDVGSDRIVSDLGRGGALCAVLGPADSFASRSRFVAARFAMPSRFGVWAATLGFRQRLARVVAAWQPDAIVPLDELSSLVLRTTAADRRTGAALRDLLVGSLGQIVGYEAACHRVSLMRVAARLGVRVPSFAEAAGRAGSAGLPFPLMVKRDHSSGSGGVTLVRDGAVLKRVLGKARLKNAAKRGLARLAGFRHGATPILLQGHVAGDLAMRTVACRDGVVLDGVTFRAVEVHPTKRASTMLQALEHPEMAEAACRLVAALGCSGFVSFDFILDSAGHAFLIEMNPRPIGSTHLGRLFGHDLGHAFLTGAADPVPGPAPLAPDTIVALFPKELERDPASPCLNGASALFHDVPRDEPQVLDAYLAHLADLDPGGIDALRAKLGLAPVEAPSVDGIWTQPVRRAEA